MKIRVPSFYVLVDDFNGNDDNKKAIDIMFCAMGFSEHIREDMVEDIVNSQGNSCRLFRGASFADATLISKTLQGLGCEVTPVAEDQSHRTRIKDYFFKKVLPGTLGVFGLIFFAIVVVAVLAMVGVIKNEYSDRDNIPTAIEVAAETEELNKAKVEIETLLKEASQLREQIAQQEQDETSSTLKKSSDGGGSESQLPDLEW